LQHRRCRQLHEHTLDRNIQQLTTSRGQLPLKDQKLVARGLRQLFLAHLNSGYQFISMPSKIADDLWHEFILYAREYDKFYKQALGRFLHHTPAVVLGKHHQK